MSETLTLSGWTQPAEALLPAFPGALTFDWSHYPNAEQSFEGLKKFADVQNIVAWSMGGQLALRAIAAGVLKPRHLTLLAAPLKFVGDAGMGEQTFGQFRENYADNPARTKERFHALVAKGDALLREVMNKLTHHEKVEDVSRFLPWLDELGRYDGRALNLANTPPTLIIHGMNDHIVPIAQGEALLARLPSAQLNRWANTGHAPHLADPARLLREVMQHRASV